MMIKNILVALDGSVQSKKALLHAVQLSCHFNARLNLVNVLDTGHVPDELLHMAEVEHILKPEDFIEKTPLPNVPYHTEKPDVDDKMHAIISEKIIHEATDEANKKGIKNIRINIERGDPADRILAVADRIEADIIVMGSRGLA
jgi:nucleotide-binding universal stress UspA family protein